MLRERFPILARTAYLNSCSQGALSLDVRASYEQYLRDWEELGSPWELWVAKADEARAAFAGLVGALPEDVAVTSSLGGRVLTPERRGALVCVESSDPPALVDALAASGVITSWRDRGVRFSPHFYNDERDVDAALAALAESRALL